MSTLPQQIATTLRKSRSVLIVAHVAPDGDSLGSAVALQLALGHLGVPAVVGSQDGVPPPFAFLPGAEAILTVPPATAFDAGVAVECGTLERTGVFASALAASGNVINIDHHLSNSGFGRLNYWDTTAAAVGELIYEVIHAMGVPLDAAIAQALLTAVVTDTGRFSFPTVTAHTLRLAATLVAAGASIPPVVERVYETKTLAGLRLHGAAFTTTQVSADGQVIWTVVTPGLLAATGASPQETAGIVGTLRQVRGVRVALLFEVTPEGVRVGIRSRDGVRANVIAETLGGGGHVGAAGFSAAGTIVEVLAKTLAAVQAELDQSQRSGARPVPTV